MTYFNLGLWDNHGEDDRQRWEDVRMIADLVEQHGQVNVSFDYEGEWRTETALRKFARAIQTVGDYIAEIKCYHVKVTKA